MFEHILIPTDGSQYSEIALEYGIYLAGKLKAAITGLYIVDIKIIQSPLFNDISGSMGVPPSHEFVPLIEKGLEERGDAILAGFRKRCENAGLRPCVKKITGLVDEMIIEEGTRADCIILAQRGEHYLLTGSGLLGSTSEAVVRKSGRPVMVTPVSFREIERIGLAYDGSEPSERALKVAAELSGSLDRPLTALIITDDTEKADTLTGRIEVLLEPYSVTHSVEVRSGKEETQIVEFTQQDRVDLLVMGAYGHSRIRELILGSTTSYVIRKSAVPILMTR
jgi:nucleotide-binding universal stress UspA family protein